MSHDSGPGENASLTHRRITAEHWNIYKCDKCPPPPKKILFLEKTLFLEFFYNCISNIVRAPDKGRFQDASGDVVLYLKDFKNSQKMKRRLP